MAAPTQTAVVVTVPEAERVVAEHRAHLDRAASWGVPAHVTVLYPFVDPASIDAALSERLAEAVRGVPAFECWFRRTSWFDRDVLWLAPEPNEPFRALTRAVWRAFPAHPPYGGAYDDLSPHLTVGQDLKEGDLAELISIEPLVSSRLPVSSYVDRVHLLAGSPEPAGWHTLHVLRLGSPS